MKHAASLLSILLMLVACGSDAQRGSSGLDADPWTEMSEDALTARIAAARREASASDRLVLLDFIATWCEDCREVVRLSHLPPARPRARFVPEARAQTYAMELLRRSLLRGRRSMSTSCATHSEVLDRTGCSCALSSRRPRFSRRSTT
jgi:thiol-disulfide isomerase/thioredoxin